MPETELMVLQCVGPSMLPTFNERGDLVLMEHYSVFAEKIRSGRVPDTSCKELGIGSLLQGYLRDGFQCRRHCCGEEHAEPQICSLQEGFGSGRRSNHSETLCGHREALQHNCKLLPPSYNASARNANSFCGLILLRQWLHTYKRHAAVLPYQDF